MNLKKNSTGQQLSLTTREFDALELLFKCMKRVLNSGYVHKGNDVVTVKDVGEIYFSANRVVVDVSNKFTGVSDVYSKS
jgi:hypothetical protein